MQNRKDTLKAAGIDTGKFFAMDVPEGATIIIATPDGVQHKYDKNGNCIDDILAKINDIGYIKEDPHFRRWIMAQTFDILNSGRSVENYIQYCKGGYMYQFEVVANELKALCKLSGEAFEERVQFFTRDVILSLCNQYMEILKEFVKSRPVKNHQGRPYINLPGFGKGVHLKDIEGMVYAPFESALDMMNEVWDVTNWKFVKGFNKFKSHIIKKATYGHSLNVDWLAAYQGEGAYYTMMGLIKFHGCRVYAHRYNRYGTREPMADFEYDLEGSITVVKDKAKEIKRGYCYYYRHLDWYKLYGMLKEMIFDNGFDFAAKMAEKYGR